MNTPNITEKKWWSADSVRQACIKNSLYTKGDCEEYDRMLDTVRSSTPTVENLYLIASDIQQHSKGQTITNIMFILANEAMTTTFEIDGMDDI